ncbi:MAG: hypothetical protein IJ191_04030 [Treponema sp.]|nr:hypothetical protein [Treponema sp.]
MDNETIVYRLDKIDKQLSELVELSKQTALQEVRIAQVEKDTHNLQNDISDVKLKVGALEKRGGDIALKWVGIIGGGIVSILLGYIAIRLGLK